MRQTHLIMGMPVTIEVVEPTPTQRRAAEDVFGYLQKIDERFSPFKPDSEVSKIRDGRLKLAEVSAEMMDILLLCEQTKWQTGGYFDVWARRFDPSGLVKGWAANKAAEILWSSGARNFFLDASGDIQTSGVNQNSQPWQVGIRNPFQPEQIVKVLYLSGGGVATSGSYIRGNHIYDPHQPDQDVDKIISLTVVGPNVYEADRFATAAFAMGRGGINFLEDWNGLEGYMIGQDGIATFTSGFERYVAEEVRA